MKTATLDDFMAVNDQFAAMLDAGIPLEIGLGVSQRNASKSLERINASVARRASRGATLSESLSPDDGSVPAAYRCAMKLGLASGDLAAAVDQAHELAVAVAQPRFAIRSALVYPLIVSALASLSMYAFCVFYAPTLNSVYRSFDVPPGRGLRALRAACELQPLWLAIPAVVFLALAIWWIQGGRAAATSKGGLMAGWRLLPGAAAAMTNQRWASFAESLARLLEAGVPADDAMRLAACAVGDASVKSSADHLAAALFNERAKETAAAGAFPPFLRWALLDAAPAAPDARALRMVADVYRSAAARGFDQMRILTPMAACIAIGGVVTLLYALAAFMPVIDLLWALASPSTR